MSAECNEAGIGGKYRLDRCAEESSKLLEFYAIPGGRWVSICEHLSADEAAQTIASMPVNVFMNHETYALTDPDPVMKIIIDGVKQAEQVMKK